MPGGADGLACPDAVRAPHVSEVPQRLPSQRSVLPGEEEERKETANRRRGMPVTRAVEQAGQFGWCAVVLHIAVDGMLSVDRVPQEVVCVDIEV